MNRCPILKVYGHILPVSDAFYAALNTACSAAIADSHDEPVLQRDGEAACVSFEGVYFPVEEVLEVVALHIGPEHKGRLDVMDMENWRLTRHVIDGGLRANSVGLNSVLDYAGM